MSFYSDASLVMIPSGYKTSKVYSAVPTDGTGDLTFTRSNATATRVGPDGLIEKVRTNLVTYSQDFSNAAWSKSAGTTLTHSQTDPDGGTTATRVVMTSGANNFFTQAISGSGTRFITLSVWVKGVTTGGTFSLNTGTAASRTGTTITYTTTWTRYDIIQNETTSNTGFQIDNYSDSVGQVAGDFLIAFAQVESSDFGPTPYIATTTAAVSVGPVANVPRLDYLNSSCPRLILEGQRTNVITFSEQMGNAAWAKTNATITENQTTSPSGYVDADKLIPSSGQQGILQQNHLITANQANTMSIFAKAGELNIITLANRDNASASNAAIVEFDLSTGVISTAASASGVYSAASGTITNYGNGWYRLTLTFTSSASVTNRVRLFTDFSGDGTKGLFVWGAQFETNASYASSYVNTLGAAVTRGADAASKTGISSLIGQTEGVLFVDFVPNNTPASGVQQWLFFLGSGSAYIAIFISSGQKLRANVANTTDQAIIDTSFNLVAGTRYKAALAYKENDFAFYVNGVQIGIDTSGTVPALSTLQNNYNTTAANSSNAGLNQALLFKTRLTNSQLAALTTL